MDMTRLADYLVRRREALGLDRKEVADRSGLSYPYVSQLETGAKRPSTRALRLLAEALEVSVGEVLAVAGEDLPSSRRTAAPITRPSLAAEDAGWLSNPHYAEHHADMPSSAGFMTPYGDELTSARHDLVPRLRRQLREYSAATRLAVLHELQADALAELARERR